MGLHPPPLLESQAPPLLPGLGWPFLKVESEPPGPSVDAQGRDLIYLFIAWPVCSGGGGGQHPPHTGSQTERRDTRPI